MDAEAQRELEILATLAEGDHVTQRVLARRLGVALGLTNLYLKRLARKGYVKITTIPPRRMQYLVTPRGLVEKTRLTYEYLRYSLRLYRQTRQTLRDTLQPLAEGGMKRIVLWGTDETAELAYLTLRELGIEPVAVLDCGGGGSFLGYPVLDARALAAEDFDYVLVTALESFERAFEELGDRGIPRDRVIRLDLHPPGEREGGRPRG